MRPAEWDGTIPGTHSGMQKPAGTAWAGMLKYESRSPACVSKNQTVKLKWVLLPSDLFPANLKSTCFLRYHANGVSGAFSKCHRLMKSKWKAFTARSLY